jgi:hypothetical protein
MRRLQALSATDRLKIWEVRKAIQPSGAVTAPAIEPSWAQSGESIRTADDLAGPQCGHEGGKKRP